MNCFDCSAEATPAVAVCSHCGGGVCRDHATVEPHHFTRIVPLDLHVPIEPPARLIFCPTCASAVAAKRRSS